MTNVKDQTNKEWVDDYDSIESEEGKRIRQRTPAQNKSLHKWFELLAEALDAGGYDMRTLIKIPIRPNKENVKTEIAHPVMVAQFPELIDDKGDISTASLSSAQCVELFEILNRAFGEKLGLHVPWPSQDSQRIESQK